MEFYLFRHGPSQDRNPRRWPDDERRPLTVQGIAETRRAAAGFAKIVRSVDHLASSPATRARRTAEILADAIDAPKVQYWEEARPGAPAAPLLERIGHDGGSTGRFVLVGHEPTLSELIGLSVTGEIAGIVELSKAGAARVDFPQSAGPQGGRLRWLLTRKQLMARS